jgi:hypothetical protein
MSERAALDTPFPARWQSIIDDLWANDGRTIGQLTPEIVRAIKQLTPPLAEEFLALVLHSPKVHRGVLLVNPVRGIASGHRAEELALDLAALPRGKTREAMGHALSLYVKLHGGVGMSEFVRAIAKVADEVRTEASIKKAQRSRRRLGTSRPPGRPTTGQK